MLSAPSQLLLRSKDLFSEGKWLLANPADSQIFSELKGVQLSGFHQYFDIYQQCQAMGQGQHLFAAEYPQTPEFDGAVVYMPKAKVQAQMLLANIATAVKPGGTILLVGENKAGVKSAAKMLENYGEHVNKLDSARHCALFGTCIDKAVPEFKLDKWLKTYEFTVGEQYLSLCSLPGVFSHGELDQGTKLLLENLPPVVSGKVLDFGCGAGVIGCYLALQNSQAQVTMTDVSALALYCAEQSANANKVNVELVPSDGLSEIHGKFAGVYTNPPFHTGVKTDYGITRDFIQGLPKILQGGAELNLVANSFLQYAPMLEEHVGPVENLMTTSKFKIHRCEYKA